MARASTSTLSARLLRTWRGPAADVQARLGVSRVAQHVEMMRLMRSVGTRREEYYQYELYRPDWSWDVKTSFLSHNRWRAISQRINPPAYHVLVDDKLVFGAMLRQGALAGPEVVGVFHPQSGCDTEGRALRSEADLERLLAGGWPDGIVFKDARGGLGRWVYVYREVANGRVVPVGKGPALDVRQLHHLLSEPGCRFVVQPRLVTHGELRPLAGDTLMTIRVATYLQDGEARILRATARIPTTGEGVDNFSAGNPAAPIVDLETGELGAAIAIEGDQWLESHPLTGARIAGRRLPHWDALRDLLMRAQQVFADLPTIGWDASITPDGPAIVEGNRSWHPDILQRPHRRGLWQGDFRRWCESRLAGNGSR